MKYFLLIMSFVTLILSGCAEPMRNYEMVLKSQPAKVKDVSFLEGNWNCDVPARNGTVNAHYIVRGNQVNVTTTDSNGSSMEFLYSAEISGDVLTLTGGSKTNAAYSNIVKKYKVVNDHAMQTISNYISGMDMTQAGGIAYCIKNN